MSTENKQVMAAFQELRKGSRTSRHTLKKFKGTRSDSKIKAIKEYC